MPPGQRGGGSTKAAANARSSKLQKEKEKVKEKDINTNTTSGSISKKRTSKNTKDSGDNSNNNGGKTNTVASTNDGNGTATAAGLARTTSQSKFQSQSQAQSQPLSRSQSNSRPNHPPPSHPHPNHQHQHTSASLTSIRSSMATPELVTIITKFAETLERLPPDLSRSLSDLKEFDTVMGSTLISLTHKLSLLLTLLEPPGPRENLSNPKSNTTPSNYYPPGQYGKVGWEKTGMGTGMSDEGVEMEVDLAKREDMGGKDEEKRKEGVAEKSDSPNVNRTTRTQSSGGGGVVIETDHQSRSIDDNNLSDPKEGVNTGDVPASGSSSLATEGDSGLSSSDPQSNVGNKTKRGVDLSNPEFTRRAPPPATATTTRTTGNQPPILGSSSSQKGGGGVATGAEKAKQGEGEAESMTTMKISARDKLALLMEITDEVKMLRMGAEDRIRTVCQGGEVLKSTTTTLDILSSLLTSLLPPRLLPQLPASSTPTGYPRLFPPFKSYSSNAAAVGLGGGVSNDMGWGECVVVGTGPVVGDDGEGNGKRDVRAADVEETESGVGREMGYGLGVRGSREMEGLGIGLGLGFGPGSGNELTTMNGGGRMTRLQQQQMQMQQGMYNEDGIMVGSSTGIGTRMGMELATMGMAGGEPSDGMEIEPPEKPVTTTRRRGAAAAAQDESLTTAGTKKRESGTGAGRGGGRKAGAGGRSKAAAGGTGEEAATSGTSTGRGRGGRTGAGKRAGANATVETTTKREKEKERERTNHKERDKERDNKQQQQQPSSHSNPPEFDHFASVYATITNPHLPSHSSPATVGAGGERGGSRNNSHGTGAAVSTTGKGRTAAGSRAVTATGRNRASGGGRDKDRGKGLGAVGERTAAAASIGGHQSLVTNGTTAGAGSNAGGSRSGSASVRPSPRLGQTGLGASSGQESEMPVPSTSRQSMGHHHPSASNVDLFPPETMGGYGNSNMGKGLKGGPYDRIAAHPSSSAAAAVNKDWMFDDSLNLQEMASYNRRTNNSAASALPGIPTTVGGMSAGGSGHGISRTMSPLGSMIGGRNDYGRMTGEERATPPPKKKRGAGSNGPGPTGGNANDADEAPAPKRRKKGQASNLHQGDASGRSSSPHQRAPPYPGANGAGPSAGVFTVSSNHPSANGSLSKGQTAGSSSWSTSLAHGGAGGRPGTPKGSAGYRDSDDGSMVGSRSSMHQHHHHHQSDGHPSEPPGGARAGGLADLVNGGLGGGGGGHHDSRGGFVNANNSSAFAETEMDVDDVEEDEDLGSDDGNRSGAGRKYCHADCHKPADSDEDMIACDAPGCDIEWFHLGCVGLDNAPQGQWFCNDCKQKSKDNKRKR